MQIYKSYYCTPSKKKQMKRLLILIALMSSGTLLNAQRGRFYESDNIGLPSFEFAEKSLLMGAILIIIAFIELNRDAHLNLINHPLFLVLS